MEPIKAKLGGRVVSGRGLAAADLARFDGELSKISAQPLHPGSLNVVLTRPVRLADSRGHAFDRGRRMLWPASADGLDVWLYRWRECPLHIIEVLAPISLREHFGLRNGDRITLRVESDCLEPIGHAARVAWIAFWLGRKRLAYSSDTYNERMKYVSTHLGATQEQPAITGFVAPAAFVSRAVIRKALRFCGIAIKFTDSAERQKITFVRLDTERCSNASDRLMRQIQNVLTYTKVSGSPYAATNFPAAYHTLYVNGTRILGQRDPSQRLALFPIDFRGKTVLDLGCNQGGMIHPLSTHVKWAVGIDYDSRMINAANLIKYSTGAHNTAFYVFDLQKEPLDLLSDFLPDGRADVCFLLSVCMWLNNWKDVISYAQAHSESMIFESNGTPEQQREQISYLGTKYGSVQLLADTSEDDPIQKNRKLFYLTGNRPG